MNSSGIKRGLATTAITALAVTGLPFFASSAHADSLESQVAVDTAVLYTPDSAFASIKNDGANSTVHLLAGAGANVVQIQFEYSTDAGATWKPIATVGRNNGAFSTEWTPPPAVYNTPVRVQAQPLNNVNVEFGAVDFSDVTVTANQESVDISNASGSAVGVFQQPYTAPGQNRLLGAVSGTTSDVAADPTLTLKSEFGAVETEDVVSTTAAGDTSRTFSGPVDFTGYPLDVTDPRVNEAIVNATAGGDDAEAVTLYSQTITNVTATAKDATVQGTGTTSGTVKVVDQNGNPIVGAEVFRAADASGAAMVPAVPAEYTNSKGEATFAGLGGSAAGTKHYFYVNTTNTPAYDNGADFIRSVTVTSYTAAPTTASAASADGAAFDFDEYAAGDVTVTVKDQNGNPLVGENVRYSWVKDAFATGVADVTTAEQTATTGAGGKATIVFPNDVEGTYTLKAYVNLDGTPGQGTGDLAAAPLEVKAGNAEIKWADGAVAQRQAGSTATFEATMELDDKTALAGRNVAITWAKNVAGNAVLSAQAAQPTGTTRTSDSAATSKTGANGSFSVAISDPSAATQVNELNGSLDATGANTPDIGNSAAPADVLDVDFLANPAVSEADTDTAQSNLSTSAAPGRPVAVEITVENADGVALTDLPVTIKTDNGFFTTPTATTLSGLKPDPAAAEGALYGEWENKGKTYETKTTDAGTARAVVAIERDPGFDDDGKVTAKVTFEVGGKTFTENVVFDSSNPMNPGTVTVELAEAAKQTVTVLPKAPTTEEVAYYVRATDQFGNLVDVDIDLSDNSADAALSHTSMPSQFTSEAPGLTASATAATSQVITGLWDNAPTLVWADAVPDVVGTPATIGFQEENAGVDGTDGTKTKDVTGTTSAIDWYSIDYAASTYSLTHTGAATQPVGTTVTSTYKAVDQNGEPIADLDVTFFRSGPDDLQDGDGNSVRTTNAQGEANYVYQGAKAGTAKVTAVVREPNLITNEGDLIPEGEKTDTVTFGTSIDETAPVAIEAKLMGRNNGARRDVLKVVTTPGAGEAQTLLYRYNARGKRVLIATKALWSNGRTTFRVRDTNGRRFTKYFVIVRGTDTTKQDRSNNKRVR